MRPGATTNTWLGTHPHPDTHMLAAHTQQQQYVYHGITKSMFEKSAHLLIATTHGTHLSILEATVTFYSIINIFNTY